MPNPTAAGIHSRLGRLESDEAAGEGGPATWKDLMLAAAGEPYERANPGPPWADLLSAWPGDL